MKPQQHDRFQERLSCEFTVPRRIREHMARVLFASVGLICVLSAEVRGAAPVAADFPELTAAVRPLETFLAGNVMTVGQDDEAPPYDSPRSCNPFPADSRILAYEEHRDFIYAVGDASQVLVPSPLAAADSARPQFVRRFIHLKPNIYVLDDFFRLAPGQPSVRWSLGCRNEPTAAGRQLRFTRGDQELVWETLWPADQTLQRVGEVPDQSGAVRSYRLELPIAAGGIRLLHVFQLRQANGNNAPATCELTEKDGQLELAISTPERRVQLTLPAPTADAGWLAIQDTAGNKLIPPRPLASGILPHGPEGVQMIERWDSAYRGSRQAGWDTGLTAPPLKDAVESGVIKPCRVIAFGCGTGTNEIYLASRGFDVTAVDVAPSALGLASEKAQKAGVRVRWLLADVLALPNLEPFDLVFDRGCYHHVRYIDAAGFVESLRRLTHPGSRCLILSCNNDRPPGVREQHMREDFSALFDFEWLRDSAIEGRDGAVRRESWSLMLRRKAD